MSSAAADYRRHTAATMSEGELTEQVRSMAQALRLLRYHTYRSDRSPAGFPDEVLIGRNGALFRELKRQGVRPSAEQRRWLAGMHAVGFNVGVWTPMDLVTGRIAREMRAIA